MKAMYIYGKNDQKGEIYNMNNNNWPASGMFQAYVSHQ